MSNEEFHEPDFSQPAELEQRVAEAPSHLTVKGIFFQSLAERAASTSGKTPGRGPYVTYKNYPLAEWLSMLVECAELCYPQVTRREGMRRLGELAYPTFAESMVGKVMLNLSGIGFVGALKLVPRIYAVTGSVGTATVVSLTEHRAVVEMRDQLDWPDAWHVGIFEGGMRIFGVEGAVRVRGVKRSSADLELVWK